MKVNSVCVIVGLTQVGWDELGVLEVSEVWGDGSESGEKSLKRNGVEDVVGDAVGLWCGFISFDSNC